MQYGDLADYYDILFNDEDGQTRYLQYVIKQLNDASSTILELACGSGMLARMLANVGYQVDASDVSQDMIAVAKQRYEEEQVAQVVWTEPTSSFQPLFQLKFFSLDMRQFTLNKKYDAILCFCDSVNYLLQIEEVTSMFQSVYQHLNEGGVFLFDCHSWNRLSEFSLGYEEANVLGDLEYQWNIDARGEEIHQTLLVWDDSFFPLRYIEEKHVQRVYRSEAIVEALNGVGFQDITIWTDFDEPGVTEGEKQFYRCRR